MTFVRARWFTRVRSRRIPQFQRYSFKGIFHTPNAGPACLSSQRDEMDFWVGEDMIEGEIPKDISGTLFRNGPGMFTYGSQRTNAFFDGDGMVVKLSFAKGRVHFRNAYVRTPEFLEEQRAGRFIHRSVFSTGNPTGGIFFNPLDFTFKNPANTAVLLWNDCLYALNEAGLPVAMCPRSLRTLASGVTSFGPDRFAGDIRTEFFAAHHRVRLTGCSWCTTG